MHEDHEVSRRARRKDTLSAEDLGILLQWHWKYGTLIFPIERRRCELSLLKLWSSFTGSRPATLVANDNSTSYKSRESSADNGSGGSLADDSDGDTLVGGESELMAQTATPQTVCYRDINLFLLRNPDNPDRDIPMAEVDFRNLKGRPEGADGYIFPIPFLFIQLICSCRLDGRRAKILQVLISTFLAAALVTWFVVVVLADNISIESGIASTVWTPFYLSIQC
jgi:hypothetical protein